MTWWDCVKNDMESLGLSQKDAQSRNKWRRGIKEIFLHPLGVDPDSSYESTKSW